MEVDCFDNIERYLWFSLLISSSKKIIRKSLAAI